MFDDANPQEERQRRVAHCGGGDAGDLLQSVQLYID